MGEVRLLILLSLFGCAQYAECESDPDFDACVVEVDEARQARRDARKAEEEANTRWCKDHGGVWFCQTNNGGSSCGCVDDEAMRNMMGRTGILVW